MKEVPAALSQAMGHVEVATNYFEQIKTANKISEEAYIKKWAAFEKRLRQLETQLNANTHAINQHKMQQETMLAQQPKALLPAPQLVKLAKEVGFTKVEAPAMMKHDEVKAAHVRGEHFAWTNCPWCWAERNIKAVLSAAVMSCLALLLLAPQLATPSYAAQVCTDAQEFQNFALSHKNKSAEIDNLTKQIKLYVANVANYKEQNSLLKKEVALLQESVTEQKKLSASCEVLIDEHKKVLADALTALDEATKESWVVSKLTTIAAIVFMVTSLLLAVVSSRGSSVVKKTFPAEQKAGSTPSQQGPVQTAPMQPGPVQAGPQQTPVQTQPQSAAPQTAPQNPQPAK